MNPVYYPVREPRNPFAEGNRKVIADRSIAFHLVCVGSTPYDEHTPYRYACYSCYEACGDLESCFKTGSAPLKNLRKGPTDKLSDQMRDHADQHSIIWNWARSQDKR